MRKLFGRNWKIAAIGLIGLVYLSFSLIYLYYGKPNSDEGWYLYASRLVFEGKIPYQDFAFSQTPLLLYIYGLPQKLFGPGIYLGRFTSVIFSVGSFLIATYVAYHYGGFVAAVATGFLMSIFTFWLYFAILTKTYAALTFLLLLTLYLLSLKISEHYKLYLVLIPIVLATGIRLSALPFSLVMLMYMLFKYKLSLKHYFFVVIFLTIVVAFCAKVFLLPSFDNAYYHLLKFHTKRWVVNSLSNKLYRILFFYLPSISRLYALPLLLYSALIWAVSANKKLRQFYQDNLFLLAYLLGILFFTLIHFISGAFYEEYILPAFVASFPLAGIGFGQIFHSITPGHPHRKFILGVLIATGIIIFLNQGNIYLRNTQNFYKIPEMSAALEKYTSLQDEIMALEGIPAVVNANRKLIPTLNMGQFSYQDLSDSDCEKYHVVNDNILLNYVKYRIPKAILITQTDLKVFETKGAHSKRANPGFPEQFIKTLKENYFLKQTENGFGQFYTTIYLYLRR